jgi:outer membrane lipoprotein-sorting protein
MKHTPFLFFFFLLAGLSSTAQDAGILAQKVKAKLASVNDYTASGVMKTDISFIKVPQSDVIVYYKKPNRFRIKKQDGISITPKGGVSVNLNSLFAGDNYTAVFAGNTTIDGLPVTIIKLLPLDENSDVVVSTLYIDEKEFLIRKASTTTKDNGTYQMEMNYGKFAQWGLPDKVVFIFSTKDYKLPKGLAFDYDAGGTKPADKKLPQNGKGKVEISYSGYSINKGLSDAVFN